MRFELLLTFKELSLLVYIILCAVKVVRKMKSQSKFYGFYSMMFIYHAQ